MFNPMKAIYSYLYDEHFGLQYNQKLLTNQIEALESQIKKIDDFDKIAWLKVAKARSEGELEEIRKKYYKIDEWMKWLENPFGIEKVSR